MGSAKKTNHAGAGRIRCLDSTCISERSRAGEQFAVDAPGVVGGRALRLLRYVVFPDDVIGFEVLGRISIPRTDAEMIGLCAV